MLGSTALLAPVAPPDAVAAAPESPPTPMRHAARVSGDDSSQLVFGGESVKLETWNYGHGPWVWRYVEVLET